MVTVEAALLILSLSTMWTSGEPWTDGWGIWCLEPQLWKKHELYVEVSGQPHICFVFFLYSQKGSRTSGFGSIVVGTLAMRSESLGWNLLFLWPYEKILPHPSTPIYKSELIICSLPVLQSRYEVLIREMDVKVLCRW